MNTHLETSFLNWPTDYKCTFEGKLQSFLACPSNPVPFQLLVVPLRSWGTQNEGHLSPAPCCSPVHDSEVDLQTRRKALLSDVKSPFDVTSRDIFLYDFFSSPLKQISFF